MICIPHVRTYFGVEYLYVHILSADSYINHFGFISDY